MTKSNWGKKRPYFSLEVTVTTEGSHGRNLGAGTEEEAMEKCFL